MEVEQPNMDQIQEFLKNPSREPFVQLNLLKFKPEDGWASYARYAKETEKLLEKFGGESIFMAKPKELLLGHETWDLVLLVKYPNRRAFMKMLSDPEYIAISKYREAAVERSVGYAMDEMSNEELLNLIK
jgi:uncharacterized protein (DUF1330 family)